MDWIIINLFVIFMGISLLVGLPMYFRRKNALDAYKKEFEEYLKNMVKLDKQYAAYIPQLNKNLNIINHWLKTGKDPTVRGGAQDAPAQRAPAAAGGLSHLPKVQNPLFAGRRDSAGCGAASGVHPVGRRRGCRLPAR